MPEFSYETISKSKKKHKMFKEFEEYFTDRL